MYSTARRTETCPLVQTVWLCDVTQCCTQPGQLCSLQRLGGNVRRHMSAITFSSFKPEEQRRVTARDDALSEPSAGGSVQLWKHRLIQQASNAAGAQTKKPRCGRIWKKKEKKKTELHSVLQGQSSLSLSISVCVCSLSDGSCWSQRTEGQSVPTSLSLSFDVCICVCRQADFRLNSKFTPRTGAVDLS